MVEAQAAHAAILATSMSEAADKLAAAVKAERLRCEGLQTIALNEAATLHGIALEKQKKSTEETVSALTDTISSMKDNIEVTHTYTHTYTHIYIHTHIHTHRHKHTHRHTYIQPLTQYTLSTLTHRHIYNQ